MVVRYTHHCGVWKPQWSVSFLSPVICHTGRAYFEIYPPPHESTLTPNNGPPRSSSIARPIPTTISLVCGYINRPPRRCTSFLDTVRIPSVNSTIGTVTISTEAERARIAVLRPFSLPFFSPTRIIIATSDIHHPSIIKASKQTQYDETRPRCSKFLEQDSRCCY
jgi:hypothetical protein